MFKRSTGQVARAGRTENVGDVPCHALGKRLLAVIAGGALLLSCVSAQAQSGESIKTRAAYDAAFRETLSKPADPSTLLRYAELAIKVGDYEGAISALERLLLIDRDQPGVRLELGMIYYRLQSWEVARAYLEGARVSERATPETRARARQLIAEIDRVHGPSRFYGDVLVGLGYSTNANSGSSGNIFALGVPFVPDPSISQRADFNAVGAAMLHHRYDPGRQDGATLETDLGLYSARQFNVNEANVSVVDLASGPRLHPFEHDLYQLTVRPFVSGRYVAVADYTVYWAGGGGLEVAAPVVDHLQSRLVLTGSHREFPDTAQAPNNNLSSGTELGATFELRGEITSNLLAVVGANLTRYAALVPSESYWSTGFGGSLSLSFANPLFRSAGPVTATASGGFLAASYDAPNPVINPLISRTQGDAYVGMLVVVPLDDQFALVTQANYSQRTASINNYTYDAFSALVGIKWRF